MARNISGLKKNVGHLYSKENQPTPEAKAAGHIKRIILKDIAKQLTTGTYKQALIELAKVLGVDADAIDLETAMHLKQMEKALVNGDTFAYNALMDRMKGKPVQAIQLEETKVLPSRFTIIDASESEEREKKFIANMKD